MDGHDETEAGSTIEPEAGAKRFTKLPEHIKLQDTVTSQQTRTARDPEAGRDTDRDFMIRYSGG